MEKKFNINDIPEPLVEQPVSMYRKPKLIFLLGFGLMITNNLLSQIGLSGYKLADSNPYSDFVLLYSLVVTFLPLILITYAAIDILIKIIKELIKTKKTK